jgi:uncharacterized protein YjiS (DUF1127 family)
LDKSIEIRHIATITPVITATSGWRHVGEIGLSTTMEDCAMRDYALNRAHFAGEVAGSSLIARFLRNWRARRAVSRLDSFDDYLLRDIGVTREDIRWAAGLPLTVNAAIALEERSTHRRRFPAEA